MYFNKIMLSTIIIGSALLIGCSNYGNKMNKLSSDVQTLDNRVKQLKNDANVIRSDVQSVKNDAMRANQRLDNQATQYRK